MLVRSRYGPPVAGISIFTSAMTSRSVILRHTDPAVHVYLQTGEQGMRSRVRRRARVKLLFDFPQFARVHVENGAAHGDFLGNPGMRPDFLDLLPGILLGVLVGEEAHWSGRRISSRRAQLRVQLVICEGREPAAGVVEKQYLCRSEYTVGDNQF